MFVFRQTPEEVLRVVHETWSNPSKGVSVGKREWENSYLRVELVDLLDRSLNIPGVNGSANVYPFLNSIDICPLLDIGLYCKFLRSGWVAIGDEVVHDQVINVT
jgi:hypothetical protein